ncbi:MAG TPA: carbon monoxide dehydrogenase subunit G [Caulobacteraceae bacterium]|nr:carbon monoxide dehydrogenase subunit G [Caulobacteraceae bacterium]
MKQAGEYRIEAPAPEVWRALNDPDVLARCIDGCETIEATGENAFRAKVRAKVGPLSAVFDAEFAITDADPPRAYTLTGGAKGGAAGFGRGVAHVRLSEDDGATVLNYEVEASVGGKLAQIGQRLIDAAARKTADDFFATFAQSVSRAPAEVLPGPPQRLLASRVLWIIIAGVGLAAAVVAFALLRR